LEESMIYWVQLIDTENYKWASRIVHMFAYPANSLLSRKRLVATNLMYV